jgi:hypothetical protein
MKNTTWDSVCRCRRPAGQLHDPRSESSRPNLQQQWGLIDSVLGQTEGKMALWTSDAAGKAPGKVIVSVDCPILPTVFKRLPALLTEARPYRSQSMSQQQKYSAHSDTKTAGSPYSGLRFSSSSTPKKISNRLPSGLGARKN